MITIYYLLYLPFFFFILAFLLTFSVDWQFTRREMHLNVQDRAQIRAPVAGGRGWLWHFLNDNIIVLKLNGVESRARKLFWLIVLRIFRSLQDHWYCKLVRVCLPHALAARDCRSFGKITLRSIDDRFSVRNEETGMLINLSCHLG